MLKISEADSIDATLHLQLEGTIVGPWVSELQKACEAGLDAGRKIELDLAEVTFADESGVETVLQLSRRGVELLNSSPFLHQQLKSAGSQLDFH